jgi:thiol-disulfide isomerase/thioredoxin
MERLTKTPSWKIESIVGSKVPDLADFSDKVLLILFFNIGCVTCLGRAIPYALKLQKQFPKLKILGIHTSFEGREFSAAQIQANVDHLKVDFPVVADQGHQTWSAYEAGGTPHWILINTNGEIEKSIFGSMPNALQRLDYSLIEIFENN